MNKAAADTTAIRGIRDPIDRMIAAIGAGGVYERREDAPFSERWRVSLPAVTLTFAEPTGDRLVIRGIIPGTIAAPDIPPPLSHMERAGRAGRKRLPKRHLYPTAVSIMLLQSVYDELASLIGRLDLPADARLQLCGVRATAEQVLSLAGVISCNADSPTPPATPP